VKEIFQVLLQQLQAGQAVILATVVEAQGATPRGAGARMLVGAQGRLCGTIGGGAVEFRSEQLALELLQRQASAEQLFSLTRDDAQKLGMVCGGSAVVYFQYVSPTDDRTAAVARQAPEWYEADRDFWLVSDVSRGGELSLHSRETAPNWLRPWLKRRLSRVREDDRDFHVEQIGVSGKVYLFGGGHVAQELEPVLSHLGFRCVVLDDRPEFASRELFPSAEQVLCVDFTRLEDYIQVTPADYVCIMTRGHASDTVVEAQVLGKRPRYNGMIGSRAKGAAVRQALEQEYGYTPAEIASIVSPIGLPIGAKTPAEIAISIAAQMITARAAE